MWKGPTAVARPESYRPTSAAPLRLRGALLFWSFVDLQLLFWFLTPTPFTGFIKEGSKNATVHYVLGREQQAGAVSDRGW